MESEKTNDGPDKKGLKSGNSGVNPKRTGTTKQDWYIK